MTRPRGYRSPERKFVPDLEAAQSIAEKLRQKGQTLVMANGCFDLFHVGHVRYLRGAKEEGDALLVAINSDRSVRELKGQGRPLLPAADRAEIVASLESVDYVLIFDDLTVDIVLRKIRPAVHAKGTDYTPESVPERETVLGYGGRIAIVGDSKDRSSKDYIRRIQDR